MSPMPPHVPARFLNALQTTAQQAWPTVEAVWLFGSRARGDHRQRSDIDLAVWAPTTGPRQWDAVVQWLQERAPTLLLIDVVRLDRAGDRLRKRVVDEGVVVYQREAGDGDDEAERPLLDQGTLALSHRAFEAFVGACADPPEPTPGLRVLMRS